MSDVPSEVPSLELSAKEQELYYKTLKRALWLTANSRIFELEQALKSISDAERLDVLSALTTLEKAIIEAKHNPFKPGTVGHAEDAALAEFLSERYELRVANINGKFVPFKYAESGIKVASLSCSFMHELPDELSESLRDFIEKAPQNKCFTTYNFQINGGGKNIGSYAFIECTKVCSRRDTVCHTIMLTVYMGAIINVQVFNAKPEKITGTTEPIYDFLSANRMSN